MKKPKFENYAIEIRPLTEEEGGGFLATFPDLPGCMADGPTYQAALTNAEQVVQEWIETARELDRSVPEPKGRLVYA